MKKAILIVLTCCFIFPCFSQTEITKAKPVSSNQTDTITINRKIVMYGNSITNQGDWNAVLKNPDVTNWGIPGYTTGQLIWTIKNLVKLKPVICFMEGGINDLYLGIPPERIYQNHVIALQELKKNNIIPVMQSIILTQYDFKRNKIIRKLNIKLKKYCVKNNFDFIDLNQFLSSEKGLKPENSKDGVHITQAAYLPWGLEVTKVLKKYGL
jgi:lysophospholipase L1-like esterase